MKIEPVKSISVVIPAYNEEKYIERCVISLESELVALTTGYEIIIVNDASMDRTEDIVKALQVNRPYLKLITNKRNLKLGGSLKAGFAQCQKDVIFYSDADLPFDFHELHKAFRIMNLKDADLILGFRHDRTDEGLVRIIYSRIYNLLMRILFGVLVKDINFSFKLIRRNALEAMNLQSEGSLIDAEIVVKAHRMRLFYCQIGIDYLKRKYGQSTLATPGIIFKIIRELIKFYPHFKQVKPLP